MALDAQPRLTDLSHGAGCACKIGPGQLQGRARRSSRSRSMPALLVGSETCDDAGVYRISDDLALVQTVDFFTPIVDDPYDFGRIAAANALSDVYAMGARPLTALNLVGFSLEQLGAEVLAAILRAAPRSPRRPACRSSAATRSTTRSPSTAWRSPASCIPSAGRAQLDRRAPATCCS